MKEDFAFLGADVFGDLVTFGTLVGLRFGLIVGEPSYGSKVGDSLGEFNGCFVGDSVGTRVVVGAYSGE